MVRKGSLNADLRFKHVDVCECTKAGLQDLGDFGEGKNGFCRSRFHRRYVIKEQAEYHGQA